jgi:hypothetical protein
MILYWDPGVTRTHTLSTLATCVTKKEGCEDLPVFVFLNEYPKYETIEGRSNQDVSCLPVVTACRMCSVFSYTR